MDWKTASDNNYKVGYDDQGNMRRLNRATIVDGNLLQAVIAKPLSSRDQYLLDSLNPMYDTMSDVYNTVHTYSANTWDNAKLTGFSAIKIYPNTVWYGKQSASNVFNISAKPDSYVTVTQRRLYY